VGVHVVRARLVKAALYVCVVAAAVAVAMLTALGWAVLAWAGGTAAFLVFVVDAGPDVDTPRVRPPADEVSWRRRAG
jgi:hypothetical protein